MMMKRGIPLAIALGCGSLLGGCVAGVAPVVAPVTLNVKGPVAAGSAASGAKVGRSEAWGFAFVAMGDASIASAMQNGGITRIHHVDQETLNILWIYSRYTTIVYGE
jgi:hypothetical protein